MGWSAVATDYDQGETDHVMTLPTGDAGDLMVAVAARYDTNGFNADDFGLTSEDGAWSPVAPPSSVDYNSNFYVHMLWKVRGASDATAEFSAPWVDGEEGTGCIIGNLAVPDLANVEPTWGDDLGELMPPAQDPSSGGSLVIPVDGAFTASSVVVGGSMLVSSTTTNYEPPPVVYGAEVLVGDPGGGTFDIERYAFPSELLDGDGGDTLMEVALWCYESAGGGINFTITWTDFDPQIILANFGLFPDGGFIVGSMKGVMVSMGTTSA